ncbi:MAG: ABC-type sugar transport system, periplasmic component [Ilumatobacteraceae bacterium]|nr:ABC-type sugar transport system, periplasmic component [Ilumatobacteraceae bacterium]
MLVVGAALVAAACSSDAGRTGAASTSGPVAAASATIASVAIDRSVTSPTATQATDAPSTTAIAASSSTSTSVAAPRTRCTPTTDAGNIMIWDSLGGDAAPKELDALIAEFNAAHGVQVQRTHVGGYEDVLTSLADTPLDEWPSIVIASDKATRTLLDSARFLHPEDCADSAPRRAALLPAVRDRYSMSDQLVAVPLGVSTLVLLFDSVEYAQAGLDPAAPLGSLDALLAAAHQIRTSGASPHGLVLDDSCTSLVVEQYAARRGEVLSMPANGHDREAVHVQLATPDNVAAFRALRSGVESGDVTYVGPNAGGFDDLTRIVAENDGGTMAIHTSAALGDLLALFAAGSFQGAQLGVLPLPGPGSGALAGGNAMWLVDHDDALLNGAAWSVIAWLAAPPQLARFDAATGYVPTSADVVADPAIQAAWAAHPELKVGYDQLASVSDSIAAGGLAVGPATDVDSAMFGGCTAIMQDGKDPTAVLNDLTTSVNSLVDVYRGTG